MEKRALVGTILVLVALIFIGSTFILPWYSIRIEFTSTLDMTYAAKTDYYLDHVVNT